MNNTYTKNIAKLCESNGYELHELSKEFNENGTVFVNIFITPNNKYAPDLYVSYDRESNKFNIRVQTTSYGALNIDNEYEEFYKQINKTYTLASNLNILLDIELINEV